MKKYYLYMGQQLQYNHPHPDRTTKASHSDWLNHPDCFTIWPTREAMARALRKQERRPSQCTDMSPLVRLKDGEGF